MSYLFVGGGTKDTTVVLIQGTGNGRYDCKFGYSSRGTSITKTGSSSISTDVNTDPNLIPDESLYKLYKMTGKPDFIESVGIRAELKGKGGSSAQSEAVDPNGYYSALGLNPYALKFLDEESFGALVSGMKIQAIKRIHPDASGKEPSPEDVEYFQRLLKACDVLGNTDKRKEYSSWLRQKNNITP